MYRKQPNDMSLGELWNLHEEITAELTRKMTAEKAKLDERLRDLGDVSVKRERRPYPKVRANTAIQTIPKRLGRAVENNRAGWMLNCVRARSWISF